MIEPVEGLVHSHELSFSDQIAHERQDLVSRSVEFLAGADGVLEAYQDDRERVNLRLARGCADTVEAAYREWWDRASGEPPPWAAAVKTISAGVHRILKPLGFKKKGACFNRETEPGMIQVVELRRLEQQGSEHVRVDVGIFLVRAHELVHPDWGAPPAWVSEPHCQIRQPLATSPGPEKASFPLQAGGGVVVAFVETVVVGVLERLRTVDDIFAATDDGRTPLGWLKSEPRAIASILADRGRVAEAREVLQGVYEESRPVARLSLIELSDRLGAGPIETGSEPTLSRSDEAFLVSWVAAQESRIGELAQLVAEHPAARRRLGFAGRRHSAELDRSTTSVAELWRWLFVAVPQADELIPEPQPLPSRYRFSLIEELSPAQQHLADLVASYLGDVIAEHRPEARWGLDGSAELGLSGAGFYRLLSRTHEAIRWAKQPPPTVDNPADRRFDQLTPVVERAIAAL